MTLFELSDVIPIDEDKDSKGVTRSLFRVTEYPWKTAKSVSAVLSCGTELSISIVIIPINTFAVQLCAARV